MKLKSMEESARLQFAHKIFLGVDHHGNTADVIRKTRDPSGDVIEPHMAFRAVIKIEPQRIDTGGDSRDGVFLPGDSANFYPRASALQPTPQSRRHHVQSSVRPRACLMTV